MYVKKLKLANFKSFKGENNIFEFSPHINYFVGNNNAGKSTVIEALEFMSSPRADGAAGRMRGMTSPLETILKINSINQMLQQRKRKRSKNV